MMLDVALRTVRTRWVSFAGAFVALALGVGVITSIGLVMAAASAASDGLGVQRFATAPAVVQSPSSVPVHTVKGVSRQFAARPPALDAELISRVAATGAVVADRTFPAQLAGAASGQVGHPWSVAQFAPYRLAAGRAPAGPADVVVPAGSGALGNRVSVLTRQGRADYTVVGLAEPAGFESALFFSDDQAATLSPKVDALVALGPVDAVRQAVAGDADVLTGPDRQRADPATVANGFRSVLTLLGVTGGIAAFVSIFVVSSTFAFVVAQLRRETALLRLLGATPAQVQRTVLAEAGIVGAVSGAVGCVLGVVGAPLLTWWLRDQQLVPSSFSAGPSVLPLVLAPAAGLAVALVGVAAASWRAGRLRPVEALREADVEATPMTRGRWVSGLFLVVTAVAVLGWVAVVQPKIATIPLLYLGVLLLPVAAFALLSPVLTPPLVRLVMLPMRWSSGAGPTLVRANAVAAVRRTAATAAPVLLTVGLATAMLGAVSTIDAAAMCEARQRVLAEQIVVPANTTQLNQEVLARVRATGAVVVAPAAMSGYTANARGDIHHFHLAAVDPIALARAESVPVTAGSLSALDDGGIVVSTDWNLTVGAHATVELDTGDTLSLRVVGVMQAGIRGPDAYLSAAHAADFPIAAAYIAPGTADTAALNQAVAGLGARVESRAVWIEGTASTAFRASWLGLLAALGISPGAGGRAGPMAGERTRRTSLA
ncbi:FtsX-like permease family protein, partial [Amycolatopsis sp. NPDC000673]|uniref:ABC transporter permease n=1 Tax=Amycolatopsis sp. NPDC000673 TaxID=3154267 RepID=UPI0033265B6D